MKSVTLSWYKKQNSFLKFSFGFSPAKEQGSPSEAGHLLVVVPRNLSPDHIFWSKGFYSDMRVLG
jgi:hypothetical protein